MKIEKNKLVTTLDEVQNEFKISVDVKISSIARSANLIHFTTGGNTGYGLTSKISFYHLNSSMKFVGSNYKIVSHIATKLEEWEHIEILQIQDTIGYVKTIFLNGNKLFTTINNETQTFYNVSCYVSNPWNNAQTGFVRNLFYYYKNN